MATLVQRFVDPDSTAGGDGTTNALTGDNRAYVSLSAWEAARQAVNADLVTADVIEEAICESNGAGHTADTANTTIDGYTTDATRYLSVKTSAGGRHAGVYTTSKYRLETTNTALDLFESFTRVEGLQILMTATTGDRHGIIARGATCRLGYNIIKGAFSSTSTGNGINFQGGGGLAFNNLIYDCVNSTNVVRGLFQDGGGTALFYSNTIHNCWLGIVDGFGTTTPKNCLVNDCTSACYSGTFTNATNNASDDSTQPTTNGQDGEVVFADEANDNFALDATDTIALDLGADLSGDAGLAFSDDIIGTARPQNSVWDIGAFELIAGGGGGTTLRPSTRMLLGVGR